MICSTPTWSISQTCGARGLLAWRSRPGATVIFNVTFYDELRHLVSMPGSYFEFVLRMNLVTCILHAAGCLFLSAYWTVPVWPISLSIGLRSVRFTQTNKSEYILSFGSTDVSEHLPISRLTWYRLPLVVVVFALLACCSKTVVVVRRRQRRRSPEPLGGLRVFVARNKST